MVRALIDMARGWVKSAAVAAIVVSSAAAQQPSAGAPAYVVTAESGVPLRCASVVTRGYAVAELDAGQVLRVVNRTDGMTEVRYPPSLKLSAFVWGDKADYDEGAGTVVLTKPDRLKAAHPKSGFAGSWHPLLGEELPAGTKLKVLEVVEYRQMKAYRVEAPAAATGFVPSDRVRTATEAEIASVTAPEKPGPGVKPAEPGGETEKPAEGGGLMEPMVTPGEGQETPAEGAGEQEPVVLEQKPAVDPAVEREIGTLKQLQETFEAVIRQPAEEAELEEAIAEFQRAIDMLGEAPEDAPLLDELKGRQKLLEIRVRLRDRRRAIEEAQRAADERSKSVAVQIAKLAESRQYAMIGRLVPSTVYDGTRLPLMYRVLSVGAPIPRTLGYLMPTEALDLESKVGHVVGVVGQASFDRALMLNIITPKRVDVLTAVEETGAGEQNP